MTTIKNLDPNTPNLDAGIVITHSDVIPAFDKTIGRQASGLKVTAAGEVVYQNGADGEPGWLKFEAGEGWLIACDRVLTNATINGTLRSTSLTAVQIFFLIVANDIGANN